MPSFPSYYLNNLDRKRERSRQLREGLQSGMAGAFEGVDRLAQLQMALQGKATAGAEAKAKAEKEAEALAHGREIEAANQARADQRFAWEGEDRKRKMAREDAERTGEIADPDREAMMAGFGETLRGEGVEPTTSDILSKFRAAVENPAEATGRYAEEPGEVRPEDVEGQATSPEAGDILSRLKASLEPGATVSMEPSPPSVSDKQEAARLRKMEADAAIAERKAKGGGGSVPGVTSKKEIDRQLAELRLKAAEAKAAGGGVSTTDVDKVRKEFNALPAVKQYHDVAIAVDKMKNAAKVPSAAGDLSLIFAFMKTLDPTSTVREGEFANAQNATGVPERVLNEYNRVMSGERLNEAQRADFLTQADHFLAAHKSAYDAAAESYGGLATRRGMAPGDVVMGADAPAADPQAAFLKTALDLQKQLGRKPTKEELQDAMRAAGVLE